jgi:hypothetical protein
MRKQAYALSRTLKHLLATPLFSYYAGLFERRHHGNQTLSTSDIRSEKRHVESVMIVAKQAQRADFLNG